MGIVTLRKRTATGTRVVCPRDTTGTTEDRGEPYCWWILVPIPRNSLLLHTPNTAIHTTDLDILVREFQSQVCSIGFRF